MVVDRNNLIKMGGRMRQGVSRKEIAKGITFEIQIKKISNQRKEIYI